LGGSAGGSRGCTAAAEAAGSGGWRRGQQQQQQQYWWQQLVEVRTENERLAFAAACNCKKQQLFVSVKMIQH
jgi:hypothetical protein